MTDYIPPTLPLNDTITNGDLESKVVLKKLVSAHKYLAELKGVVTTIPNEGILISTLSLQEANSRGYSEGSQDYSLRSTFRTERKEKVPPTLYDLFK